MLVFQVLILRIWEFVLVACGFSSVDMAVCLIISLCCGNMNSNLNERLVICFLSMDSGIRLHLIMVDSISTLMD